MAERHSEYVRDEDDWYVEPASCVDRLLDRYPEVMALHDPCAGGGTIPDTAARRGILATGADLIDRANGRFPMQNFLTDNHERANICTNPPFKIAEQIVRHAMTVVQRDGIIAVIAQAKFLASQARYPIFASASMERVIVFSRRPSMPPGKMLAERGESCRGGGSADYCWLIWRVGKTGNGAMIEWTL